MITAMSVLNKPVSLWNSIVNPNEVPTVADLRQLLLTDRYRPQVEAIRAIDDEGRQKAEKNKLPGYTIGGTFAGLGARTLQEPSGLLGIDIDQDQNAEFIARHGAGTFDQMKRMVSKLPFVAYCGRSCRGLGFFLVVPIAHPEHYRQHHESLEALFSRIGIKIDPSCSNISRKRFVSFDPEPYVNDQAETYTAMKLPEVPAQKPRPFSVARGTGQGSPLDEFSDHTSADTVASWFKGAGWKVWRYGGKIYLRRPGKESGQSGNIWSKDGGTPITCIFTSNAEPFEKKESYNPAQVYANLFHGGDLSRTASELLAMGYGKATRTADSPTWTQTPSPGQKT